MSEQHVKGLRELNEFLQQLPVKIERNVLRGALRSGMKVVLPLSPSKIHSVSGELAKGLKIGTRARGGKVTSNLKATGPHRSIAHLVEYGTKAHTITPKSEKGWLSFLGVFAKKIEHPGARSKPFLRPALDAQAQAAVIAAGEYIKSRLETKHGIDTAHITVEGDE